MHTCSINPLESAHLRYDDSLMIDSSDSAKVANFVAAFLLLFDKNLTV